MQRPVRSGSRAQLLNPLRISHPKIDKLACQTQGADIFAIGEIPLLDACFAYLRYNLKSYFVIISHNFSIFKMFLKIIVVFD